GRALRPGGVCMASVFLLDYYRRGHPRPRGFAAKDFSFDHAVEGTDGQVMTSDPTCPEAMLAVRWSLLQDLAERSDLLVTCQPHPGEWSGTHQTWTMGQDLVVLTKQ